MPLLASVAATRAPGGSSLTELQTLELVRVVQVRDLMPLGHMLWLRGLSLAGCSVEDVTPVARLTNLEALDLCQTQVRDLSPLAALTGSQLTAHRVQRSDPLRRQLRT